MKQGMCSGVPRCRPAEQMRGPWVQRVHLAGGIPIAAVLPHAEYDPEGFETFSARELYNIHTDHLNAPRRLTRTADASDAIVWRWIRTRLASDSKWAIWMGTGTI